MLWYEKVMCLVGQLVEGYIFCLVFWGGGWRDGRWLVICYARLERLRWPSCCVWNSSVEGGRRLCAVSGWWRGRGGRRLCAVSGWGRGRGGRRLCAGVAIFGGVVVWGGREEAATSRPLQSDRGRGCSHRATSRGHTRQWPHISGLTILKSPGSGAGGMLLVVWEGGGTF
jgi:hypothetical protein